MDFSCVILSCLLLLQMILTLTLLNPMYDVRKITDLIKNTMKVHKKRYYTIISSYFGLVIYLGMYIPLQNIHTMIFSNDLNAYEKLVLLSRVEKNYIIAGFSLFLVVVLYGVRALLSYTANLALMAEKPNSEPLLLRTKSKKFADNNENILPNLLRVKRSISYEAILCTNELKEQLKLIMQNIDAPQQRNTVSSILRDIEHQPRSEIVSK